MAFRTDTRGDQEFEQSMRNAIALLDSLEKQAQKSDKAVQEFGKTMDDLSKQLSKIQKDGGKFIVPTLPGKSTSRQNADALKASATLDKLAKQGTALIGAADKGLIGLTSTLGAAVPVVGLVTASLVAMERAGRAANKRNVELASSFRTLDIEQDAVLSASVESANKANEVSVRWKKVGQDFQQAFEPVFEFLLNASQALAGIFTFTSPYDTVGGSGGYAGDMSSSKLMRFMAGLEADNISTISDSSRVLAEIVGHARQVGFDLASANNLAIGTYEQAIKKAKELGLVANDVARDLANAWQKGSEAASKYGVVLSENVLTGWMSERGYDPMVEISDAMKEAYSYQMMLEQLNTTMTQQEMSEYIRHWEELGAQINEAKQTLFEFDEVINLTAKDTTVPTILGTDGTLSVEPRLDKPALDELYEYLKDHPALMNLLLLLPREDLALFLEIVKNNPGRLDILLDSIPTDSVQAFRAWIHKTAALQNIKVGHIDTTLLDNFRRQVQQMVIQLKVQPVFTSWQEKGSQGYMTAGQSAMNLIEDERTKYMGTKVSSTPTTTSTPTTQATTKTSAATNSRSQPPTLQEAVKEAFYHFGGKTNSLGFNTGGQYSQDRIMSVINRTGLRQWNSMSWADREKELKNSSWLTTITGGYLGFAKGGIGTKEMDARLFEGNKAEAVIPLETPEGISYLANAMKEAGGGSLSGGSEIHVHLSQQGFFDTNDTYQINKYADLIGNAIQLRLNQRGGV